MSSKPRQDVLEELMDLGLQALLERFRNGEVTASELSAVHKMFKDAGLSLAFEGRPTSRTVDAVLESLRDYDPDGTAH